jgi:AcrR family transcriptional regulator
VAMGRPRAFDKDNALDRALHVFWERGYEGTSIADLTEAMGINPPSLYAAFGNKEQLFRAAIERYEQRRDEVMAEAFAAPSAREAMTRLLQDTADRLGDSSKPAGCLYVSGALAGGVECEGIKRELATRRAGGEALIRERLKRAKREGDLPKDTDPAALARFIATVMQGMAVQASGGATRKELRAIADTALKAWPGS